MFTARDAGRVAAESIEDGATPEEVCLWMTYYGVDCCEGVREKLDDVLSRQGATEKALRESQEALTEKETEALVVEALSWLALIPQFRLLLGGSGVIYKLWRAKNAEAETKRILRRLMDGSNDAAVVVEEYAKKSAELLERVK